MRSSARFAQCEALDARRLFAIINYNVPNPGNISVISFDDNDDIDVWQVGSTTHVIVNGFVFYPVPGPLTGLLVRGGGGNDNISVSINSTIPVTIYGEAGDDIISGTNYPDTIYGGDGNDYIDGNNGNDVIYGGKGNDALVGDNGNDTIYGEAGNDALRGDAGGDILSGGDGIDKVDYSYMTTRIRVTLDNITNDGAASGNTSTEWDNVWSDCEWIIGGSGNDTLDASYITTHSVTLIGGAGNDIIAGGAWNDYIDGGPGTDTLVASGGTDTVLNFP